MNSFLKMMTIFYLLIPEDIYSKSLKSMATSATNQLRMLGVSVIALGLVWAGYLYVKGGGEGKQKLAEVITGAVLILGGAAIVQLIRSVVGG